MTASSILEVLLKILYQLPQPSTLQVLQRLRFGRGKCIQRKLYPPRNREIEKRGLLTKRERPTWCPFLRVVLTDIQRRHLAPCIPDRLGALPHSLRTVFRTRRTSIEQCRPLLTMACGTSLMIVCLADRIEAFHGQDDKHETWCKVALGTIGLASTQCTGTDAGTCMRSRVHARSTSWDKREYILNRFHCRTGRGTRHFWCLRVRLIQVRRDLEGIHDKSARVWVLDRRQGVWWLCDAFGLEQPRDVWELDPDGRE